MINNSVSVDEFRSNLADILGKVMYGKNRIIIKKYNRKAAVLISVDEYEKLLDPTKRLSPKQWKNKFKAIDTIRESIPDVDAEILEKEVSKAVQEVRTQKQTK